MGGTFDPVHYGHLIIAETARVEFNLDRVLWIPAGDPPHKPGRVRTPQEHRHAMVLLATAAHPQFEVSRIELERSGPSFTFDTVTALRERHPSAELFFLTGADAILEILTWHRHADVIHLCRFIAATRPGHDLGRLGTVLPARYLQCIDTIATPGVDISSTQIRERVRSQASIRYLLPDSVETYIQKHRLYADTGESPAAPGG